MGFDDKLHFYWGGSGGKRGYCACGITRSCNDPSKHCNCDSLRFIRNLEDRGYLTIKKHLPVRRIDYFDVESESGKVGISSLGALECWNLSKYLPLSFFTLDRIDFQNMQHLNTFTLVESQEA